MKNEILKLVLKNLEYMENNITTSGISELVNDIEDYVVKKIHEWKIMYDPSERP